MTVSRNLRVGAINRAEAFTRYASLWVRADRDKKMILNIDEAAIMIGQAPSKAWAPIGEPNVAFEGCCTPKRFTLLLGIMDNGEFFGQLIEGSCTGVIFADYLTKIGKSAHKNRCIVICDNATIHRTGYVQQATKEAGIDLNFVPPYYPTGSPIEYLFSILKGRIARDPPVD